LFGRIQGRRPTVPQPRKYHSDAHRQAAYRLRRSKAGQTLLTTGHLALQPKVSQIPATRRWGQAVRQAQGLLELVEQEMQDYYGQRSESWQEAEKGEAFQERLDAVTEARESLDELIG
jgi:hypothetical protein